MDYLWFAPIIGLIPAAIAYRKGRSFALWWFAGTMLFIVALPCALLAKADTAEMERRAVASGASKKCPRCAELVKPEAQMCRYCGNDLMAAVPAVAEPPPKLTPQQESGGYAIIAIVSILVFCLAIIAGVYSLR